MKKSPVVLICGLAAILLTVVLFLIIVGNPFDATMSVLALAAILLAEVISTAYIWCIKGSPRKLAAAVVSCVMTPYAVILSAIYLADCSERYDTFVGWYCVGTIVVNAICLILASFDSRKTGEDNRIQNAKGSMNDLRKIVKCILVDPAAQAYSAQLAVLEEKLEYSRDYVITAEDERIRMMLLQLQERIADPNFDSKQMIAQIEKAIDKRNIMAK